MANATLHVATIRGLQAGLGVEDIAVPHKLRADDVRGKVRELRDNGYLFGIVRDGRKAWEKERTRGRG